MTNQPSTSPSSDCAAVAEKVDACEITVAFVGKGGNRKAELLRCPHSLLARGCEHASAVLHLKCEILHLKVKGIYNFVRDEILFGYNTDDSIPASRVLSDGCGQCNTKSTLFMALLRACSIECRIHGFTIHKRLQKGAMTGLVYLLAPDNVFHSRVEVHLGDRWYITEGIILDSRYLSGLRRKLPPHAGPFVGYGVAVKDWRDINVDLTEMIPSYRAKV